MVDHARLVDALRTLPLHQRSVVLLRYMEGRSEHDTAELLGVSLGTVKSRAARGMATLRTLGLLDDDGVLEPG